ncbi:Bacteriophage replication protein O [Parageobacillus caldoxylosilyticus]|uniref:replication protein n=1 Tax=Saccharococcus caldoxylosilyticus TaxID=81408 RepID=UPI001C4DF278|nr:replication protein [Parageobacillus caldoxylosilyticus]QXJ39555.1 Bacteriophage replication protein O [Parageobacillus caldoxylosilyticus]
MADVQLEHGYTKIANEILERLALTKLSPTQFRLILVIWRYTYGFNRKDHAMSLSFLAEATGVHKQRVKQELDKLIESNIIIVTEEGTFSKSRKLAFNKNYDTWRLQSTKESTVSEIAYTTVSKNADTTVSEIADSTVSEFAYQEIKNINKNLNKYKEDDEYTVGKILDLLQKSKILEKEDITEFLREDIQDVIDNFGFTNPEEMIVEAIKDAARGNGKTWKFVYNKLNTWRKQGIKTIEDLDKGDTNGTVHKHRRGVGRSAKEGGKSYEQILREAEADRKAWGWRE